MLNQNDVERLTAAHGPVWVERFLAGMNGPRSEATAALSRVLAAARAK